MLGSSLKSQFSFPSDFIHYNHGSFGTCPIVVKEYAEKLRQQWYNQPDEFWDEHLTPLYHSCVDDVAKRLLGLDTINGIGKRMVEDGQNVSLQVSLVDNATTGLNLIASSLILSHLSKEISIHTSKPVIVLMTTTYNAVKNTFERYCVPWFELIYVKLPFPVENQNQVIETWSKSLQDITNQNKSIEMVVLDHIISENSLVLPIKEMISLARQHKTRLICVDGAHAPGNLDLTSISKWDVNFYTGNLHKWCFAPTSVAVMYSSSDLPLHHPMVSHSFKQGISEECGMLGTRDYSALLSSSGALDWIHSLDMKKVRLHTQSQVWKAAQDLAKLWNTCVGQPLEMTASMCTVKLPLKDTKNLRYTLRHQYHMEIQNPFLVDQDWWLRISCTAFMESNDFQALGQAILDISRRLASGETFVKE